MHGVLAPFLFGLYKGTKDKRMTGKIAIKRMKATEEAEKCAKMMANSEPWITLGRGYESLLNTLTASAKEVYIGWAQKEIVGCITLIMQGACVGYIQTVYVSPSWRGKGVGSALIAYAEERIFTEKPNVFICVSSFNEGARRWYKRLGYEEIGELKDYIVAGYSEILLRKTISPLSEFVEERNRQHLVKK